MQRVKISLVCLLSLTLTGVLVAQTAVDPNADVGTASLQDFSGGATLSGTYFDVRNMTGDGVGHRSGFTQIGAFTPIWLNEDFFIAPNARLIVTDNSRVGANLGAVGRRYSSNKDRIFGINSYFDSDETTFGNRYQQVTLGLETLGTNWDFRANGYLALGTDDRFLNEIGVSGNPFFVGNQIAFLGQELREESLTGGDFEFGVPVTPTMPWLRAYAGMYGYQSNSDQKPVGVRARLEAWISDDLSVGVNVTDDRQFGTNVNAVVDFRFAGFKPTRYFPQWTTRERMLMPVQRNWRVSTNAYVEDVNVAAINPADSNEYFVTHIDNTAAPGGDGTFERPFNLLPPSAPGSDLILVAAGTTSEATPLVGSIALENGQRMLGEGKAHTADMFVTYGGDVINGNFVLPGFTDSGNYPFLSSGGNTITLANNNEVAAFNLVNAAGAAITNTPTGSSEFLLQCLEITGNVGGGINLTQATGTGIIRGINLNSGSTNHANVPTPPNLGGIGDNGNNATTGGIFVDTGAAGLELTLTDVAMNTNPNVQSFGVSLLADDGSLTTTLTNVEANGFSPGLGNLGAGIRLSQAGQTLTATLTNVSANNNAGVGVQVMGTAPGGTISLSSDSLTANGNGLDNLQIGTQAAPLLGTTFTGNISNSFFNNSQAGSGIVYSQSAGSGTLNLTNIQANGNSNLPGLGGDGLGLFGAAATTMNVNVIDSFLTTNTREGIHIEQIGGSTINLFVDPTDVRFNGRDGLFFNLAGVSTLNIESRNNLFNNNNRSAVHGELNASTVNLGTALVAFNNNTGNLSGGHGLFLDANATSTANLFISNGTFADSGRLVAGSDGVHIESDASIVNLTMTDTPANNTPLPPAGTQRDGLNLDIRNASTFTGAITNGNFTNSLRYGLHATIAGGSTANLTLDNTSLSNSGLDGMNVVVTDAGTVASITLQNGSLNDNSGGDGLRFVVSAGQLTVNATDSSFTNSGAGGVLGSGITGGIFTSGLVNLNFTNTPVTNSRNHGMGVLALNANIQAVFNNSPLNDNGLTFGEGVGLLLNNSNNSLLTLTNNSTVSRNADDGIDISATNGTIFTGTFDNLSITDNGRVDPAGNGVVVQSDNSAVGMTFNTATIGNSAGIVSQQIGLLFTSQAAGTIDAAFTASNLSSNTLNAFNGLATGANSRATVGLDGTVADSSGGDGAVLVSQAGGQLDFNLANASSLNTSGAAGLVGTVTGANALLNVSLDASTINNSATFGAFLNAAAGGELNVDGINTSSISLSGLAGVATLVDGTGGASAANFAFDSMAINDNGAFGGEGFNIAVLNGGSANVGLANSTVTGNSLQGVEILVDGTNSIANFGVDTSVINDNGSEGLLIGVSNSGVLNYRSQNSSYTANGVNTASDGVQATVTGTGPVDTVTTARFLFSGDTVDSNTDDGFEFNANNGGTLVVSIADGTSASTNAGFGLRFNPNDAGTKAYLLMTGSNLFNTNTLGPIDFNSGAITGIETAVVSLSGSFNNANGDGIHLNLTDIANVAVAIQGPGTINDSLDNGGGGAADNGDGIDIRLTNNTLATMNGTILINGLDNIDRSAADGIHIEMTNAVLANTFNGALEISGIGSIATSGGDAIDISMIGMTMGSGLTFPVGVSPLVLTLVDSVDLTTPLAPPLNAGLPLPVLLDLSTSGLVPATALTLDTVVASGSVGRGINLLGQNSTIADNGMTITNNVVSGSQGGDGLHVDFDTVTGPAAAPLVGTLIDGNGFATNSGHGLHLELVNSPINQLTITDNIGGTGISSNGLDGIRVSLSGATGSSLTDLVLDGNLIASNGTTGTGHGVNFQTVTNSNITNTTINNNTITGNAGDGFRLLDPNTLGTAIDLTITDNTISGNTANGFNFQFSNGEDLTLLMTGNTIGSVGAGNGGMGVRAVISGVAPNVSTLNATIGDSTATANTFTGNGDAGVGIIMSDDSTGSLVVANSSFTGTINGTDATFAGVGLGVFLADNAQLNPVLIGDAAVQNTSFNQNAAGGVLLELRDAAQVVGPVQLLNVQANTNTGNGMSVRLFNDSQIGDGVGGATDLLVQGTVAGATVSNNTLNGLRIERLDNSGLPEVLITGMTFDNNTQTGISLRHSNGVFATAPTVYTINLNTITNNDQDGIGLDALSSVQVVGDITQNTITGNLNNGIRMTLTQSATLGDPIGGALTRIDGNTFATNGNADGEAAINISTSNASYANVEITGTLQRQTFNGDQNGIIINNNSSYFNGGVLPAGVVAQNTFTIQGADIANSVASGISLNNAGTNGANQTGIFTIGGTAAGEDVTISNFGNNGIQFGVTVNGVTGGANATVTIQDTTITHPFGAAGGVDGIRLALTGNDTITIHDTSVFRSGGDGIDISDTAGGSTVDIRRTTSDGNSGRGLVVNVQHNGGTSAVNVTPSSIFNIGNLADTGANRNSFSSNGLQGLLYLQRATTDGASIVVQQNIQNAPGAIVRLDQGSPDNLIMLANVINNDMNSNGNLGLPNDADGSAFLVGTNTRLFMNYSGNGRETQGVLGNLGDDFRLVPIVSVNPAGSTDALPNNGPGPAPDGFDTYRRDPVAHVDILFGGDVVYGPAPFPLAGTNGGLTPLNFGEQINVSNTGFTPTGIAGVQTLFTNADVFKGNNRSTVMNGEIYVDTNLNNNLYFQTGVQQFPATVFGNIPNFTLSPYPFP